MPRINDAVTKSQLLSTIRIGNNGSKDIFRQTIEQRLPEAAYSENFYSIGSTNTVNSVKRNKYSIKESEDD